MHLIEANIKQTKVKVKVGNVILKIIEVRTELRQSDVMSSILFILVLE